MCTRICFARTTRESERLQHLLCSDCRLMSGARHRAPGKAHRKNARPVFTLDIRVTIRSETLDTGVPLLLAPPPPV